MAACLCSGDVGTRLTSTSGACSALLEMQSGGANWLDRRDANGAATKPEYKPITPTIPNLSLCSGYANYATENYTADVVWTLSLPYRDDSRSWRRRILLVLAVPLWLAYGALYGLVGWWDEMRDAWRKS